MNVMERYRKWVTEDFQNRDGEYPRSGLPDTIEVYPASVTTPKVPMMIMTFKNTSIRDGVDFARGFCQRNSLPAGRIEGYQDGDYHNDWIIVEITP